MSNLGSVARKGAIRPDSASVFEPFAYDAGALLMGLARPETKSSDQFVQQRLASFRSRVSNPSVNQP
jgi:hypothetical protein